MALNFFFLAYLAKIVLPEDYAVVAYVLIVINVSTFLYSIPTAIFIKLYYKKQEKSLASNQLLQIIACFLIVVVISLPIIVSKTDIETPFLLCFIIICFLNIFRVVQQSTLRVSLNIKLLNIYNAIYPLSLWMIFIIFEFFDFGLKSINLVLIYVLSFIVLAVFALKNVRLSYLRINSLATALNFKSFKLIITYFFIQGGVFVFTYSDRIIVALTQSASLVGGVQFIDIFVNMPFMLVSMIYFILQPMIMANKDYFNWLCKYYLHLNVLIGFVFACAYLVYLFFIETFIFPIYPNYSDSYWVIEYALGTKIFILLTFISNIYLICSDKEKWMIVYQWVIVSVGILVYLANLSNLTVELIYSISLSLSIVYYLSSFVVSFIHLKKAGGKL